ncbi:MAG TPA: UDP-3-O-acyl-N-acetylglucosamine deacetylase, partial [Candidatus Latescibacteria bacterium]|nr:UDP-3-O-acyl-N-acetylglucosamine deacetylase [Candidatus Latescibacterota bacterium]
MQGLSQYTLAAPVTLEGIGLHTGQPVRVVISPGQDRHISFVRDGTRIRADLDHVEQTSRCTSLGHNGAGVATVEHLMATLSAFGVTSADLCVDGPEVPIMDGSAREFVRSLRGVGLLGLSGSRRVLRLSSPVWLEENGSHLLAVPSDRFRVTAAIRFEHPLVGTQISDVLVDAGTFEHELASARTFGFESELEELARRGLALGGSLENAVVFFNDKTSTPLRYPDEPVRHKAVDLIGDLALL